MDRDQQQVVAHGLREGRPDAWDALFVNYSEPIWRYVARMMGNLPHDVADVVQETFLAAARSARSYDAQRGTLNMWLAGIAAHQVKLHYRRSINATNSTRHVWPSHSSTVARSVASTIQRTRRRQQWKRKKW